MNTWLFRVIGIAVLYILASPVYLVLAVRRLQRSVRAAEVIRRGVAWCPHDGTPIPLARRNQHSCGYVSESSLVLPCEWCGEDIAPPGGIALVACPTCGVSVKVEVP
jgi:hypothetical protein